MNADFSECSTPPEDIRDNTTTAYLNSEFTYWACREYRSTKTKGVYYRIEKVSDGEYIHLIPAHGKTAVDPMDYRYTAATVFQTCARIRQMLMGAAIEPVASKCGPP